MTSVVSYKKHKPNEEKEYRAADTTDFPIRYLNMSGQDLTTNKNYAWSGTEEQFQNICEKYEWDGLSLIPKK